MEDKGKQGLGFLPAIPNEWDEENGENLFLSLSCGAQGSERERYSGYPAHKTRGILSELLVAPSSPHPSVIHCQLQGWHGRAHNATHSFCPIQFPEAWAGLLWGFFLSPFLHFEISTLDTEGQADPLLLYVNASHNVQAMSFPEGLNEVFGMLSMGLSLAWHMGHSGWLLGTAPPCHPVPLLCPFIEIPFPDCQDEAKIAKSHF